MDKKWFVLFASFADVSLALFDNKCLAAQAEYPFKKASNDSRLRFLQQQLHTRFMSSTSLSRESLSFEQIMSARAASAQWAKHLDKQPDSDETKTLRREQRKRMVTINQLASLLKENAALSQSIKNWGSYLLFLETAKDLDGALAKTELIKYINDEIKKPSNEGQLYQKVIEETFRGIDLGQEHFFYSLPNKENVCFSTSYRSFTTVVTTRLLRFHRFNLSEQVKTIKRTLDELTLEQKELLDTQEALIRTL